VSTWTVAYQEWVRQIHAAQNKIDWSFLLTESQKKFQEVDETSAETIVADFVELPDNLVRRSSTWVNPVVMSEKQNDTQSDRQSEHQSGEQGQSDRQGDRQPYGKPDGQEDDQQKGDNQDRNQNTIMDRNQTTMIDRN
jgi:hypothetical protein